jgi:hypothetical protein
MEYPWDCGSGCVKVREGYVLFQRYWAVKIALCALDAAAATLLMFVSRRNNVFR